MTRNVMLVPVAKTSGIYTASLGLVQALNNNGVKAALFSPLPAALRLSATIRA